MDALPVAARRFRHCVRDRGLLVLGLALFVASLPLYKAWSSRDVLGRWSHGYVLFMVLCALGLVAVIVAAVRLSRSKSAGTQASTRVLSAGVFLWGLSYFVSALDSPPAAARILDSNAFGTTFPPSVLLDWLAAALFAVAVGLWAARRLPSRWHNTALAVGSIAAILVLGEGIARVRSLVAPETQGFPTYSEALWTRRYVTLNDIGFRDVAHAPQKADTVRRLLVVGDSFTFGVGVQAIPDRFGEQLAPRLGAAARGRWEAINAGRPDTHTLQHLETLERMLAFRPDLVVLLYVFNDIDYLAPVTARPGLLGQGGILKFHPVRLLFLNSYLFQELYIRWRKVVRALGSPNPPPDPYRDAALLARHMDDLTRFVRAVRDGGATAMIVPFDNLIGTSDGQRARYDAFVATAEARGLPVCSIAAAMAGRDSAELRVNSLDGHPNELANHLAAEAAAACLAARIGTAKPGAQ